MIQAGPWIVAWGLDPAGPCNQLFGLRHITWPLKVTISHQGGNTCYTHIIILERSKAGLIMSTCLCNLKKSPEESCKDEIRFLNSLFTKVKGFDWFSLKKRDLITVFKYMQGFYPGPMRVLRTTCSVCTEKRGHKPRLWQGDISNIKGHRTQTS